MIRAFRSEKLEPQVWGRKRGERLLFATPDKTARNAKSIINRPSLNSIPPTRQHRMLYRSNRLSRIHSVFQNELRDRTAFSRIPTCRHGVASKRFVVQTIGAMKRWPYVVLHGSALYVWRPRTRDESNKMRDAFDKATYRRLPNPETSAFSPSVNSMTNTKKKRLRCLKRAIHKISTSKNIGDSVCTSRHRRSRIPHANQQEAQVSGTKICPSLAP